MAFYTEDKVVVKTHLMQSAKRLMSASKFEGSAQCAQQLIAIASTVDKWETTPKTAPTPRKSK